jgi:hypothetical protein
MEIEKIGVAWYRKKDYDLVRDLFTDGQNLPLTYEEWERQADAFSNRMASQGVGIRRVYIDPQKFLTWCRSQGLPIDARARQQFVNEFVEK